MFVLIFHADYAHIHSIACFEQAEYDAERKEFEKKLKEALGSKELFDR